MPVELLLHKTELIEIPTSVRQIPGRTIIRKGDNSFAVISSSETPNFKTVTNNLGGSAAEVYKVMSEGKYSYAKHNILSCQSCTTSETEVEANLTRDLKHPNIVETQDFVINPKTGELFFLLKSYEGGNLEEGVKNINGLNQVKKILKQISNALSYAHSKGIVHADLCGDNILLDNDGNAYLADLGVSKILWTGKKTISEPQGRMEYAAPELYKGIFSPKSDSYALTMILIQMLTHSQQVDLWGISMFNDPINFAQCFMPEIGNQEIKLRKILADGMSKMPENRLTVESLNHEFQNLFN